MQRELRLWNSRCNLTRLVEGDDYWVAQVQGSLRPLSRMPPLRGPLRGVDVGTGGDIPGLVLAVALPESRWVLVDSVQRKCAAVPRGSHQIQTQLRQPPGNGHQARLISAWVERNTMPWRGSCSPAPNSALA